MKNIYLLQVLTFISIVAFGQEEFTIRDLNKHQWKDGQLLKHDLKMSIELSNSISRIIELDQKLRADGIPTGSSTDHENRRLLDSIIGIHGWPSSVAMETKGIGIAIILAHQGNLNSDDFDYYYKLAASKSLKLEERWGVPLFILEQRYQWLGSDLRVYNENPDTLTLLTDNSGIIDSIYAEPYMAAMSKTLGTNSSKKVRIFVNNLELAEIIKQLLYDLDSAEDIPQEFLDMMIAQGFDPPKKLSDDRLLFEIDENLDKDKIAYKFFR